MEKRKHFLPINVKPHGGGGRKGGARDRYIKRKKNLPECESVKVPAEEECGGHHHHNDEGGQRVHCEHFPQLKSKNSTILVIVVWYFVLKMRRTTENTGKRHRVRNSK